MCDIEMLIAGPAEIDIEGGTAHMVLRSGKEVLRFAISPYNLMLTIAEAKRALVAFQGCQRGPIPIRRGIET